jgi:ribosomal protein L37AE/L43A
VGAVTRVRERLHRSSPPADLPSSIKPPERCPFCNSVKVTPKGSRIKKLETVRLYRCRACGRTFAPGPRALRNKTYPPGEILEALTTYNRGHSLEDTSRRLSSRYGHTINPATISRWLAQHPRLTTYRRLRAGQGMGRVVRQVLLESFP